MKNMIVLAVSAISLITSAAEYRIKYATTVDVIDGGKKVGVKQLKPGTIVTDQIKEDVNDDAAPESQGKLKLTVSPAVFLATRPTTAVFNAEVGLSTYNFGLDTNKYWPITIVSRNEDWSLATHISGCVKKTDAVGKRLFNVVKDGQDHKVRVKVSPFGKPDDKAAQILDFEIVTE